MKHQTATTPIHGRIDIGWLGLGPFGAAERRAIERARLETQRFVAREFPEFEWVLHAVDIERHLPSPAEPTRLLEEGIVERDARHLDFVLVVTNADLNARTRARTFATPSRVLGVGVLSTHRLQPPPAVEAVADDQATDVVAARLTQLAIRVIAHLAGAEPVDDDAFVMGRLTAAADLDAPRQLSPTARDDLAEALADIADPRLEELAGKPMAAVGFYARALLLNVRPILAALRRIRPWRLPLRLGKLTAAAISALLILVSTAEGWDVAAANDFSTLVPLALVVLTATSLFLVRRHTLVMGRGARPTEQRVVSDVSVVIAVVVGLLATFAMLWFGAFALGLALYPQTLIAAWVSSSTTITTAIYAQLATVAASLGLLIGALGASLEPPHALRHAAYVDEEL